MISTRALRSCTFRTSQKGDLWRVTRDRAFYGEYRSRAQAVAAACFGAQAAEAHGTAARVLDGPGEKVVSHHLPSAL